MTFSAGGAIEFGQRMLQVASQGTEAFFQNKEASSAKLRQGSGGSLLVVRI